MGDTAYEWGRAGKLRACRDYLGLSGYDMAEQLGMARRSLQRMETGQAAIPVGLWETIEALHVKFDAQVQNVVNHAEGMGHGMPVDVTIPDDSSRWDRMVVARAMRAVSIPGSLLPRTPDDYEAEKEMSCQPSTSAGAKSRPASGSNPTP